MSKKDMILPNNFKTESEPPEIDAKSAHSAPEIAPNDGQNVPGSAQSDAPNAVVGASGARPAAEAAVGAHSNAPKSKRGPKTERGKRSISRNAIKHAILCEHPVAIPGFETIEEWEEFEAEMVEAWAPEGRYERELATDVAFGLWRLRRCRIHEAATLGQQVQQEMEELFKPPDEDDDWDEDDEEDPDEDEDTPEPEPPEPVRVDPATVRAQQQLNIIPNGYKIDRILRYEAHVRRCLNQTVHELEAHQARRQGEHPSLARVEFNAGPTLRSPTASGSSALKEASNTIQLARHYLSQKRRRARFPSDAAE